MTALQTPLERADLWGTTDRYIFVCWRDPVLARRLDGGNALLLNVLL
jgi:hypothetical protein